MRQPSGQALLAEVMPTWGSLDLLPVAELLDANRAFRDLHGVVTPIGERVGVEGHSVDIIDEPGAGCHRRAGPRVQVPIAVHPQDQRHDAA
eukprot:CAMPEP_0170320124 /NCGR_PEP_ID=MMETSP0116_2-20130129/60785_1 /TAXON_ID=400756 /ORGANISM="Durinskia baltica, Strain CSIRO CS-38" /LENGTH=90 /DNA_ID=CAMNT_0010572873 /DNA_START=64 /DNA_END=336 /DNA_ORIENTATION=+